MTVFDLNAKISLDTSGYDSNLDKAERDMDGFSAKTVALGDALFAVGQKAAEGFASLTKAAVGGYADYEQLVGGIDKLFGGSSQALQDYAAQAFATANMSANQYMETTTNFAAALVNSLDGDTAAAVEYANMAITDMADNANVFGTSLDSIQNAYQGFAKGNFSMLDNLKLGFGGTQAEMYRLLQTAQELDPAFDAVFSLNSKGQLEAEFADIVEAIHIVQENMGITGTTAAEAASTVAGSAATMKAAWSDWLAGLGNENADMSALTTNLVDSVQTVWSNLEPVLSNIKANLIESFSALTGIDLSGLTAQFEQFGSGLSEFFNPIIDAMQSGGLSGAFETLLDSFEELTGIDMSLFTSGIETFLSVVDGFVQGGASEAFAALGDKLSEVTGLDLSQISSGLEQFGKSIDTVAGAFADGGIDAAVDALAGELEKLTGLDITGFFDDLKDTYDGVVSAFDSGGLAGLIEELWASFQEAGPKISEAGAEILTSIGEMLTQIGETIYNVMPETVQGLIDSIGGFFESLWDYLGVLWEQMQPIIALITVTLWEGIKGAFDNISGTFDLLVESVSDILDFLSAQFDIIVALWEGDFEGAADAIKRSWESVVDFFAGIIEDIKRGFDNLAEYFSGIGSRMWEGLKGGFSAAVDGVKGIGEDIAGGFKKLFGINSPSRLFAEYGGYMAQGLEKGWDSKIDSVVRGMAEGVNFSGSVDFAHSAIGKSSAASINASMLGQAQTGGNMTVNLVVDGKTLASVLLDPLKQTLRQKGEVLA